MALAVATDPTLVANRLCQSLTEGNAYVLNRVVIVDVQVALARDSHIDQCVACQLVEHVVEKPDAGLIVILAGTIEIDLDGNVGFGSFARDGCCPHGGLLWRGAVAV
jgi:hypothetical protein